MDFYFPALRHLSPLQKGTLVLSALLFIISLPLPAFCIAGEVDCTKWLGWSLLTMGWMGVFVLSVGSAIWLANPLYIITVVSILKNKERGVWLSFITSGIGFSFSQLNKMMADQSGGYRIISSLQAGYYFWLGSFFVLTIGMTLDRYLKSRKKVVRR